MGYTKVIILPLLKSMDFGLLDRDFVLEKLKIVVHEDILMVWVGP